MTLYTKKTKPALRVGLPSERAKRDLKARTALGHDLSYQSLKRRPRATQTPRKAIPRRSKRMIGLMAQYQKQKERFLSQWQHTWCMVCIDSGRGSTATEIHHRKGRGKYLLDESTWTPVCRTCHRYIHDHPSWAYGEGWLEKRITKIIP